jgi:hypothetical protein
VFCKIHELCEEVVVGARWLALVTVEFIVGDCLCGLWLNACEDRYILAVPYSFFLVESVEQTVNSKETHTHTHTNYKQREGN